MKKAIAMFMAVSMAAAMLVGCGDNSADGESTAASPTTEAAEKKTEGSSNSEVSGPINVISREDGSGTRGAFIELFGIEEKNDAGEKVDMTTEDAQITNNTSVMMTTVAGDTSAIGYISLGSLNDTVKAVKIDGADASGENVKNGSYKVSRPFNIVTKDDLSEAAQDFVDFILSSDGQAVVEEEGLEEAYKSLNRGVEIEVQQSDSTTGVTSASEGLCDIGMASRELKDSESALGLTTTVIATDGIAVIVNKESTVEDLTADQVKGIYTGEITDWSDIAK